MLLIEQKDRDLATLVMLKQAFSRYPGAQLLVTGSYAIEALTNTKVDHHDVDVNVLSPDIPSAIFTTLSLIANQVGNLHLYKHSEDRLEYNLPLTSQDTHRLELHFIEAALLPNSLSRVFKLNSTSPNRIAQMSLTDASLKDSKGREHPFVVKSLAYSIASWALRISDFANNQLRPVRSSDLNHLSLLLAQDYSLPEVLEAIEHHPQMIDLIKPQIVFQTALDKLERVSS